MEDDSRKLLPSRKFTASWGDKLQSQKHSSSERKCEVFREVQTQLGYTADTVHRLPSPSTSQRLSVLSPSELQLQPF